MKPSQNLLPADGEIYFYPELFSQEESDNLFTGLKNHINWKQEPVIIMGRKIMQPRLTALYGDAGKPYRYTGITMTPNAWTADLLMIKKRIAELFGHSFTSALLNFYRNGNDSIGWHRDNEKELGIDPVIASVSLGAARNFYLKHSKDKKLKQKLTLTPGSLLLMKGATQHNWFHSIPKEPKVAEARINITFRTII